MTTSSTRPRRWDDNDDDDDDDDDKDDWQGDGVPSVEVDGFQYRSDRFHLLRPKGFRQKNNNNDDDDGGCRCGARAAPPLLDRSRLIASLDLKAAILATYTLDPVWCMQEFPSLFGESDTIPTLVLHGHKVSSLSKRKQIESLGRYNYRSSIRAAQSQTTMESPAAKRLNRSESLDSRYTDDEYTPQSPPRRRGTKRVKEEDESPPEEGWMGKKEEEEEPVITTNNNNNVANLPPHVHLTKILPSWLPPRPSTPPYGCPTNKNKRAKLDHVIVIDSDDDDYNDCVGVDPDIVSRRQVRRGVHHPKYMILFEKSGSVVVVVSTANLTKPTCVEGVWLQRFKPKGKTKRMRRLASDGSDFGHVLADFLQCQSEAAESTTTTTTMLPTNFLRKHTGFQSLEAFRDGFCFEQSEVHLIATVPGDYMGRHYCTHMGRRHQVESKQQQQQQQRQHTFLYGPQRVADIVARLSKRTSSGLWFPDTLLSSKDRLVAQPTSLGGYWTRTQMSELARLYLGMDETPNSHRSRGCDDSLLERLDIVWPSDNFINGERPYSNKKKKGDTSDGVNRSKSPASVVSSSLLVDTKRPQHDSDDDDDHDNGFVFLSSQLFNSIDLPCISRMVLYEDAYPRQLVESQSRRRFPHIKSVCRLFEGSESDLRTRHGVKRAEDYLSWFLLTSACLSRGAQGIPSQKSPLETSYANFELGVLFCSRLRGDNNDRMYCFKPSQCQCWGSKGPELVHLPIPFSVRPMPYQRDAREANFWTTPYFHEISADTGCVGQMQLTPLGSQLARRQK